MFVPNEKIMQQDHASNGKTISGEVEMTRISAVIDEGH
jgi:hypothetical protein